MAPRSTDRVVPTLVRLVRFGSGRRLRYPPALMTLLFCVTAESITVLGVMPGYQVDLLIFSETAAHSGRTSPKTT